MFFLDAKKTQALEAWINYAHNSTAVDAATAENGTQWLYIMHIDLKVCFYHLVTLCLVPDVHLVQGSLVSETIWSKTTKAW